MLSWCTLPAPLISWINAVVIKYSRSCHIMQCATEWTALAISTRIYCILVLWKLCLNLRGYGILDERKKHLCSKGFVE
jgi:hypothetical protein